jgi:hypothetical protein
MAIGISARAGWRGTAAISTERGQFLFICSCLASAIFSYAAKD